MRIYLSLFIILLFFSPVLSQSSYDTLYVANHKLNCTGVAPQDCFLIKNSENENWKFHYNEIKGFDFIPGNEYIIVAEKLYTATQAADAASFYYNLVKIISSEPTMVITDSDREKLDGNSFALSGMVIENNFDTKSDFSKVNIYFDLNNNRVNGRDGCNNINGKIKIDSGKIEFLPMTSTKMMCRDAETFTSFHKNIALVNSFRSSGDKLLFYKDNELLLEFEIKQ